MPTTDIIEWLNSLSDEELQQLAQHTDALENLRAQNPLDFFDPYPRQKEFIKLGATKRERLFMAGNRVGKSACGAYEASCHLTGCYPDSFEGKRFNRPTTGWVCGASGQAIRDVSQLKMFGIAADVTDTGMVPRDLIIQTTPSHGVSGLYDTVRIRHKSGGISTLVFKSYEQDIGKWMGTELDFCWVDEEPPADHYNEALSRLTGDGIMFVTFTPLGGLTDLLCRFLREDDPVKAADRAVIQMSLDEALHFSADERQKRIAGYSAHELDARRYGTPMLGSGAVFTTPMSQLQIGELQVPTHWAKVWGIDFGGASATSHPFAAVLIAWDRDTDTVYVLETIKLQGSRIIDHAAAIKRLAPDIRVAWPHDGMEQDKASGRTLASAYKAHGLKMLPGHATWPDGGYSTEAGIVEMDQRMSDGRFRVRAHLADWADEYRGYHRKDGKLVRARDDLMSATRIAIMSLRYAQAGPMGGNLNVAGRPDHARPQIKIAKGVDFDPFANFDLHRGGVYGGRPW